MKNGEHSCRRSWETSSFWCLPFSSFCHRRMRKTDLKLILPSPSSWSDLATIKRRRDRRKLFHGGEYNINCPRNKEKIIKTNKEYDDVRFCFFLNKYKIIWVNYTSNLWTFIIVWPLSLRNAITCFFPVFSSYRFHVRFHHYTDWADWFGAPESKKRVTGSNYLLVSWLKLLLVASQIRHNTQL